MPDDASIESSAMAVPARPQRRWTIMDLLESLYKRGLGQLPVLFVRANGAYLGNLIYEKDHLVLRDRGFLDGPLSGHDENWWRGHMLGLVCHRRAEAWESLTFCGVGHCVAPGELDAAHLAALRRTRNAAGESADTFVCSIYRACQALLDGGFLPVVVPHRITGAHGDDGLAMADLRALGLGATVETKVRDAIGASVRFRLTFDIAGDGEPP
jgi:hypothetical protein